MTNTMAQEVENITLRETHICEACGHAFAPHPKSSKRFCAKATCRQARSDQSRARGTANRATRPTDDQRRANSAVFNPRDPADIIPMPWRKGQMTEAEFRKELDRARKQLIAAGEPLFRDDLFAFGDKARRQHEELN